MLCSLSHHTQVKRCSYLGGKNERFHKIFRRTAALFLHPAQSHSFTRVNSWHEGNTKAPAWHLPYNIKTNVINRQKQNIPLPVTSAAAGKLLSVHPGAGHTLPLLAFSLPCHTLYLLSVCSLTYLQAFSPQTTGFFLFFFLSPYINKSFGQYVQKLWTNGPSTLIVVVCKVLFFRGHSAASPITPVSPLHLFSLSLTLEFKSAPASSLTPSPYPDTHMLFFNVIP